MATAKMKVHLYSVTKNAKSPALEMTLKKIASDSLSERLRTIDNHDVRLEEVSKGSDGLWRLDFGKLRFDNGPGRATKIDPITGFRLGVGEGFAEETAALFDPGTKHMLIQYNHHGVRVRTIEEYLCNYDANQPNVYEFEPRLDPQVEAKLHNAIIFRRLTLGIKLGEITPAHKKQNVSLSRALDFANGVGALHLKLELGLGNDQISMLDKVKTNAIVKWAQKAIGIEEAAIDSLKVSAKPGIDQKLEIIDLLAPRISVEFINLPLGADLRVARNIRWDKLTGAHAGWKSSL